MPDQVIWLRRRPGRYGRVHLCRLRDPETGEIHAVTGASHPERAIDALLTRRQDYPEALVEVYSAGSWRPWPHVASIAVLRPRAVVWRT